MGSWFAVLCLFPDFTVVCVWLQTTSLSNWIRYKSVFFIFDCEKHTFLNPTKKGWKWRYYEVKTLSSLFLYFKRIMVDCYRAINQGIKFGNIWEICVCPQTLETLEMRLFAKRALLTATKRGGISAKSSLGSIPPGVKLRRVLSAKDWDRTYLSGYATNDSVCLSVMRVLGCFLVAFFCWKHKLQFSLYLLNGMKNVSMREKCRFKHCLSVKERSF